MSARVRFAGWAAIATLAVVYGPMAVEYMWRFFNPDAPSLWDHAFAGVVDHDEAFGPGSIHAEQAPAYAENRVVLLVHTSAGGLAIIGFAAQFSARLRRNLRRHRLIGRISVGLALTGMLGASAYLLAVGPSGTFDGPAFYIQLWALAVGTAVSTALGFAAAIRRQIAMHQALMVYAFAVLLTAPLLRVGYLVLGNVWPDTTQLETNLAGAAILATWAPFGAFLVARSMDLRVRESPAIGPLPGRSLTVVVGVACAVASLALVTMYDEVSGSIDRIVVSGVIAWLGGVTIAGGGLVGARRRHDLVAAPEWRIALLSLLAVPAFGWALWRVYDVPFGSVDAFLGSLLTAPAVPISLGFLLVVWRRRTVRRPAGAAAPVDQLQAVPLSPK